MLSTVNMLGRPFLAIKLTPVGRGTRSVERDASVQQFAVRPASEAGVNQDRPYYLIVTLANVPLELRLGSRISRRLNERADRRFFEHLAAHAFPVRGDRAQFSRAVAGNRPQPHVLVSYVQHSWFDGDAIEWATHGIGADDATEWIKLGVSATEVNAFEGVRTEPAHVIEIWQAAGIPFDEIADWLGAGLMPEEASQQRADGVSIEQAAALRSLRKL